MLFSSTIFIGISGVGRLWHGKEKRYVNWLGNFLPYSEAKKVIFWVIFKI